MTYLCGKMEELSKQIVTGHVLLSIDYETPHVCSTTRH